MLTFVGLPFVVRTVQPVLQDFEVGEGAGGHSLGATRWTDVPARRVSLAVPGAG